MSSLEQHPAVPASRRWRRRAGYLLRRSRFERYWLLPSWLLLGLSRAAVLTVPFRHLAPLMGETQGPRPWVPLLTPAQRQRAVLCGRAVRQAARFTPWNSNCFAQALTASVLLRVYRLPYTLHFGLARSEDGNELQAHAWVSAGQVHVTGGAGFARYTVVGSFASPGRGRS